MARDADRRKFSDFSPDRCGMLHELYDFTPEQITACTYHPELMEAVYLAARRAVSQCQRQNERSTWNCSISHNQTDDLFGKVLKDGKSTLVSPAVLTGNNRKYCKTDRPMQPFSGQVLVDKWLICC
jgi:hypothetical protein